MFYTGSHFYILLLRLFTESRVFFTPPHLYQLTEFGGIHFGKPTRVVPPTLEFL